MFGFHLISNLGWCLEVPLLHERCKTSVQFIFDRLSQKSNAQKGIFLSLVGRVTLVKLALSTIPYYVIQTMKLLATICIEIDKVCRQFVWDSS